MESGGVILTNAVLAAERYRRATELQQRAKADLIEAIKRERDVVNVSGIAAVAGIYPSTLFKWTAQKARSNNGGI